MGWNRKRTQLQSYFAGLFDGEGTLGIYANRSPNSHTSYFLKVSIQMTDGSSIALLKKEYPEGNIRIDGRRRETSHNLVVNFDLNGNHAYRFLKEIKPYVLIKWKQVKVALSYLVHFRRDHGRGGKAAYPCQRCEHFMLIMKELKPVTDKGMVTVNAWIEHGLREYRSEPQQVIDDVAEATAIIKKAEEALESKDRKVTSVEPISVPEQDVLQT